MHWPTANFDSKFITTAPELPDPFSADRLSQGGRRVSVLCPMSTIPPPSPVASLRFTSYQWLAAAEVRRMLKRRVPLEADDMSQAALFGLMQADRRATPDMPDSEFERYARAVIRGAMIDELRRVSHGGRDKGIDPKKPRQPEPGALAMAQNAGLIPTKTRWSKTLDLVSADPNPEESLAAKERALLVKEAIDAMGPRSRDIIWRRLQGERADVLAREYGISQARTSQVVGEAVAALRAWSR